MAGITFSEVEVKRLILALAGSKAAPDAARDEAQESPGHEADPKDKSEDAAEGEAEDKPEGKAFDSKAMLVKKLKEGK